MHCEGVISGGMVLCLAVAPHAAADGRCRTCDHLRGGGAASAHSRRQGTRNVNAT